MENLVLYHFESCHFCKKVIRFIKENDIDIPMEDVQKNEKALQELLDITKRYTVPCLMIDGKPMHESENIIQWLSDRFLNAGKN